MVRSMRQIEAEQLVDRRTYDRIAQMRCIKAFHSVEDVWRRAGVPVAALTHIAAADGFQGLGLSRREACGRSKGCMMKRCPSLQRPTIASAVAPESIEPQVSSARHDGRPRSGRGLPQHGAQSPRASARVSARASRSRALSAVPNAAARPRNGSRYQLRDWCWCGRYCQRGSSEHAVSPMRRACHTRSTPPPLDSARYLIRVMFWQPQMPIAQPSTRIVVGPSSRRCPE